MAYNQTLFTFPTVRKWECLHAFEHIDIHIHRDIAQNRLVQIKLVSSRTMNQHIPQKKINKQITEKEMFHKPYFEWTTMF